MIRNTNEICLDAFTGRLNHVKYTLGVCICLWNKELKLTCHCFAKQL